MAIVLKNNKERVLNLGTLDGHMLVFNPEEEKTISESVSKTFDSTIVKYVDAGFISVVTKTKESNLVDNSEKAPLVKKTASKKATKKKTTRVAKE